MFRKLITAVMSLMLLCSTVHAASTLYWMAGPNGTLTDGTTTVSGSNKITETLTDWQSSKSFTATANPGYQFRNFSSSTGVKGTTSTWSFTDDGKIHVDPITITANFTTTLNQFDLFVHGPPDAVDIKAGRIHTVVLKRDGTVSAWGGQDGQSDPEIATLTGVTAIGVGPYTTFVVTNGIVKGYGVFADNKAVSNIPVSGYPPPSSLTNVVALASGLSHTAALKSDGTVVVWGVDTGWGQFKVPSFSGLKATAIAAGHNFTLVILEDGSLIGWGQDGDHQISDLITKTAGKKVVAIAASAWHSLALLDNGTVVCAGQDDFQQASGMPAGLNNVKAIAAGGHHSVALKKDGTVVVWGGNPTNSGVPQGYVPAGAAGASLIGAGYYHSAAVTQSAILGWGNDESKQCEAPVAAYTAIVNGSASCTTMSQYSSTVEYGSDSVCTVNPKTGMKTFFAVNGVARILSGGSTTISNIQAFQTVTVAFGTAPDAPTIASASTAGGVATVTLTPPANNGGSPVTGYTVKSQPAGAGVVDADAGTTSLTHTVTGLASGTSYTFTATATNLFGTSVDSGSSKQPQTITITTPAPASAAINSAFTVAATAPGGTVTYSAAGGCSNNGATFTMTSSSVACTVKYDQGGNTTYGPAPQLSSVTLATKADQVITVTAGKAAPASAPFGSQFTVDATAPGGAVSYSAAGGCSNSGATFTMTSASDPCTVKYDQAGDATVYNPAPQLTSQTAATKADQTITVTPGKAAPASAPFGAQFTVDATAPGGAVSYTSAGGCSNNGATFTMTSATLPCTVKYDQGGSANYNAAPQVTSQTSAAKADQVITVTAGKVAPASATFGTSFTVDATAAAGSVVYSSSGGCSNVGPLFTMTSGTDPCIVKYDQAGSTSYNPAPEITSQTAATKADQAIAITSGKAAPASAQYGASFSVDATAPGGAVSYSSAGGCSNVGPLFTMTSATDSCIVRYDQPGGANYNPAPQKSSQTAATKADQVITITAGKGAPGSAQVGTVFTVDATAPGGGVSYSSAGGCSNVGAVFTITSATPCTVKFDQAGSASYNAAPEITAVTNSSKADQVITVTKAAPASASFGSSFTVDATAPGGPVTFSSSGGCSNVGPVFTITSATPCTVKFDQAGSANYNPAPEVTAVTNSSKVDQVITVTKAAPASAPFGSSFTVDATAPGGAVTFSSAGGCSNAGALFTMTSGSTPCTVKFDQAGSANYNAAPQVTSQTAAAKADQTITVSSGKGAPAAAIFGTSFTVDASAPGGAVTYSSAGGCSNVGPTFTMTSGTTPCTVKYDQAGSADYKAAPQVLSQTTAAKSDQAITVTAAAPASATVGTSFSVAATAPGGGVTFSSAGGCTNSGATFTLTTVNIDCIVRYDQGGNADYAAAPQKTSATTVVAAAPGVPGVPTGVTASAVNGQASVAFVPPTSTGTGAITGYTVTATPGNISATGSGSPILVTGLTNGTAYTFTVTAMNAAGAGAPSAASSAVTPLANGDLNGDGVVDLKDAMLALRIATGAEAATPALLTRGDVAPLVNSKPQGDGRIDVGDVIVLLRRSVGSVTW